MLWLIWLGVIGLGIYLLARRDRRMMALYNQIPCDTMLLPIIGHSYMYLGSPERTMKAFETHGREATRKGGLMGLWHANSLYIVVSDAVALEYISKHCLEKDDLMQLTKIVLGNSSIFAPVPIWRPRRKLLIPSFNPKKLNGFVEIFSTQSQIFVDKLKSSVGKGPVSIWDNVVAYAMDAVCESTMGVKLNAQSNPEEPFLNTIGKLYNLAAERMTKPWLHNDFLFTKLHLEVKECKEIAHSFVDKLIEEKRQSAVFQSTDKESLNAKPLKSLMDMMMESSEDGKGFNDLELREETLLLILAGTDTSSSGAAFTTLMLSRHQDVQEKVYQELQEVFGDSDRPVEAGDLPHLKYLEAVIKETLRLYPPAPVVTRKVDADQKLPSGITLLKGCGILVHIWAVQRNPLYWGPDAEEFRPERFIEGPVRHPAAFMAFSCGPRSCIASQYAYMSMKTIIATLLRNYRVLPAPDPVTGKIPPKDEPLKLKYDISSRHADNYMVLLESRH